MNARGAGVLGLLLAAASAGGYGLATGWLRDVRIPALAAERTASAVRRPAPPGPVRMIAVGDLMLGTSVKRLIASRGARHPFRPYRELLQGADLAFGNLETPLSDRGAPTRGKSAES